jgi:hypothetical protein
MINSISSSGAAEQSQQHAIQQASAQQKQHMQERQDSVQLSPEAQAAQKAQREADGDPKGENE